MFKIQPWRWNWDQLSVSALPLTLGMALLTAITAPASAQSVIVESGRVTFGVNQPYFVSPHTYQSPPTAAPFIYGSPIGTPILVNPATGTLPHNSYRQSYPFGRKYSDPFGRRVDDSTLINPVLVNPRIRNSTIINPVIVDQPVNRPRR